MIISCHQPCFLPWIGFWNKVLSSEGVILLGGIDYSRGDYVNRVKMGENWMTLPIDRKSGDVICELTIANDFRIEDLLKRICAHYKNKKHKYFYRLEGLLSLIESFRGQHSIKLMDFNVELFNWVFAFLGGVCPVNKSYSRSVKELKSSRLEEYLLEFFSGGDYFCGTGADYIQPMLNFDVWVQKFTSQPIDETILQLIAKESDPVDRILSAAVWELRFEKSNHNIAAS